MAEKYTDTDTRKEQIVDAVISILASEGLTGLTVKNIAETVGIVPSAVYRHFPGKNEMIDATLARVRKLIKKNIANAKNSGTDPLDILRIMFESHIRFVVNTLGAGNVFITTEIASHYPAKKNAIISNMNLFITEVNQSIKKGQVMGIIRNDLQADELGKIFTGLFMPAVMLHDLMAGKTAVEQTIKKNWSIFEKIVRK